MRVGRARRRPRSARCGPRDPRRARRSATRAVYLERRLVAPAAHRDPAARRPPRHRRAVRRARVLDPAAAPEGGRGIAVARGRRQTLRARMAAAAAAVARAVGYTNAGTIEFLLDEDGSFYFLEMNTRLQVEHPVTEMVTGIDLVQWQIRIARGERLDIDPGARADAARPRHRVPHLRRGSRPGLHAVAGPDPRAARPRPVPASATTAASPPASTVPVFYDSMIAKLVAWGGSRGEADRPHVARARRVPRARHPDDDPVLPVADAAARVPRGALRHDLPRSAAGRAPRRELQRRSPPTEAERHRHRRGARRLPACQRRPRTASRAAARSALDAARPPGGACVG